MKAQSPLPAAAAAKGTVPVARHVDLHQVSRACLPIAQHPADGAPADLITDNQIDARVWFHQPSADGARSASYGR